MDVRTAAMAIYDDEGDPVSEADLGIVELARIAGLVGFTIAADWGDWPGDDTRGDPGWHIAIPRESALDQQLRREGDGSQVWTTGRVSYRDHEIDLALVFTEIGS